MKRRFMIAFKGVTGSKDQTGKPHAKIKNLVAATSLRPENEAGRANKRDEYRQNTRDPQSRAKIKGGGQACEQARYKNAQ